MKDKQGSDRVIKICSKIGSGSINGEAFRGRIIKGYGDNCNSPNNIAIKVIPLNNNQGYTNDVIGAELICMKLCKILIKEKITPNLPLFIVIIHVINIFIQILNL